jgi:hypothetical protein
MLIPWSLIGPSVLQWTLGRNASMTCSPKVEMRTLVIMPIPTSLMQHTTNVCFTGPVEQSYLEAELRQGNPITSPTR